MQTRSFCPREGDNNKGMRRCRNPHLTQTQNKFQQSRSRLAGTRQCRGSGKGYEQRRTGWGPFPRDSCSQRNEEKKGTKGRRREVAPEEGFESVTCDLLPTVGGSEGDRWTQVVLPEVHCTKGKARSVFRGID